jgi:hypothetical protein
MIMMKCRSCLLQPCTDAHREFYFALRGFVRKSLQAHG